jgi:multidrug efflux pump subunit AcrA (membrane-fusion protein)
VLIARHSEAAANIAVADAELLQARVDLERSTVRAPIDGTVLKVNARPGQYAQPGPLEDPLMTVGQIDLMHVRTDVDEIDSWRVCPNSAATASARGNPAITVPLSFVRFEPSVVPKRQLTDGMAERVDTRVLQVIYAFDPSAFPAFVGQQVDVFIKTDNVAVAPYSQPHAMIDPAVPLCRLQNVKLETAVSPGKAAQRTSLPQE